MMTDTQGVKAQNSLPISQSRHTGDALPAVFFRIVEVMGYICFYAMRFAFRVIWAKLQCSHRSWQMILGETISDLGDGAPDQERTGNLCRFTHRACSRLSEGSRQLPSSLR